MKTIKAIFRGKQRQQSPSESSYSHPVGSETLFEGTAPIIADIVFIHGLRGHRTDTWTKDGVCWPKDLLSQESTLSHVRVLAFGYDANVVKIGGRASLNSLFEHSMDLLNGLSRERKQDADRPIIFVAHSLGGLIVKDALNQSASMQDTNPRLAQIFSATRGIIFLGTPHRGSGMASLAVVAASVARVALQTTNDNLIRDLERDSQTLDRIHDGFIRILVKRTFAVWSFVEALPLTGGRKVVTGESAIIGDAHENRETIQGDHMTMVKFPAASNNGYKKVLHAIELLLEYSPKGKQPVASETPETATSRLMAFYDVPPLRVLHFVERKAIENLFPSLDNTSSPVIVVLLGMGGAGKTQLAIDYCRRMRELGTFRTTFWLDASSLNSLHRSMLTFAKRLLPERILENSHDTAAALVKDILSDSKDPWLLVFDNLDNPSDLQDIVNSFPDRGCGVILVTSRFSGSNNLSYVIELDRMEEDEGLQLLLRGSQVDAGELVAARQILTKLGYLPLAVDQARAYISSRKLRLVDFVSEFETRKRAIMQETPRLWQYRRPFPDLEEPTSLSLLTTWEMSLSLLDVGEGHKTELRDVLTLFAFFHSAGISETLFRDDDNDTHLATSPMRIFKENGRWNHLKFERAIVRLQEQSLVQFSRRNPDEIVASLHSMVSEWLRMRLDEDMLLTFLATAVSHLKNHLDSMDAADYVTRQEALSHADNICQFEEFRTENFFEPCFTFGLFYSNHGRLEEAERMYDRALAGSERVWGLEHPFALKTMNSLGVLYKRQGRLGDAENMYDRALSGKKEVLGPEDLSTLDTINNLGILYSDESNFGDAERMYEQALAGYEKAKGPESTFALDTINNLGILYKRQGRLADAERIYNRALAGKEKLWGPEHTITLDTVINLGNLYKDQGRLEDAERMYNRGLDGYENTLGPEHTSTLNTVRNLAALYHAQERLDDAKGMYGRALDGYKKVFGPDHPSTLDIVNNLRNLDQRRYTTMQRSVDFHLFRDVSLHGGMFNIGYASAVFPYISTAFQAEPRLGERMIT